MLSGSSHVMRTTVRLTAGAAAMLFAATCDESITAPGACPDFCPITVLEVRDTTLFGAIERDSAFTGYANAVDGLRLMISGPETEIESRGVIRFLRFPDSILVGSAVRPIVAIDSFTLRLDLRSRDLAVSNLELLIHRIPSSVDSSVAFDELTPYFADSTVIGSLVVADTTTFDSLFVPVIADAFPSIEADSFITAVGISVRGSTPTFATVTTTESGLAATLRRYVKIEAADGTIEDHDDIRGASFDTFVHEPIVSPGGDILMVGGDPAARSLLRLRIPDAIIDSAEVVGAKLRLIPITPVAGAPGDSVRIQADALSADFGPKSPLITTNTTVTTQDSMIVLRGTAIPVGMADTVVVDFTTAVRGWQSDPDRPRSLMLRLSPTTEGSTIGTIFFGSSRTVGFNPVVRITYVPPFRFEGN